MYLAVLNISVETYILFKDKQYKQINTIFQLTHNSVWLRGVCRHSAKCATRHFLEAQCAFKILMIHEVLRFVLRIAFRCVLHRCGSQDIRC